MENNLIKEGALFTDGPTTIEILQLNATCSVFDDLSGDEYIKIIPVNEIKELYDLVIEINK